MRAVVYLTLALISAVALLLVHFFAYQFLLYWKYPWLDIVMHTFGGITIVFGLFALPVFRLRLPSVIHRPMGVIGATVAVGLLWEIFEAAFGFSKFEPGYMLDTSLDMASNLVGAGIGYLLVRGLRYL